MKRQTKHRFFRTIFSVACLIVAGTALVGATGCDPYDDYYDDGRGHDCIISTLDNSVYCY